MPIFGAFAPSVSSMLSHSHALNVIGANISNVNTGGYKRVDTHFSSLVSAALVPNGGIGAEITEVSNSSDYGGVRPKDFNRISQQGRLAPTQNNLDLGINGKGFFIVNTALDGGGQTLYTRDGAFQLVKGPKTTAVGEDGNPITPDTAFLADKNGHLVQGFLVNSDGTFPTSGDVQDIRLDPYVFSDQLQPTTEGNITFNLPSQKDITRPQRDLIELGGAVEAGDIYSVTVNGAVFSVTAAGGDTLNDIRDQLVDAINNDPTVGAAVTAAAGDPGTFSLTADEIYTSFTASAQATDGGVNPNNTATQSTLVAASETGDNSETFGYEMIDSAGNTQVITLLFDKIDENVWEIRAQNERTPTAQVDTVTLSGTVETGDVYSVTVDGNTVNYTVQPGDTTLDDVRDGLLNAIAAVPALQNVVTPAAGGAGALTLTAVNAGTPFTSSAGSTDPNVAQVDTLTIGGSFGALEAGDTYSVTVDGNTVTYTVTAGDTLATARANFITAINADPNVGPIVTAAPGGGAGDITLTADTAGTPFTATAAFTDVAGGVNDSSAVIATTTAGSNNDDAATSVTTTANVTPEAFSAPTTLTFDGAGNLTSADTVNFTFDFGGSTGSMALNMNDVTQFVGDFLVFDFNRDGFGQAQLESFAFDKDGVITGTFSDGTFRELYKIPLAQFVNADGLALRNGNTFAETENSGEPILSVADGDGFATFLPNTHELSNVDIAQQFTQMIQVQTAYNSASRAFTTVDEMLMTARDLKR